MQEDSEGRIEGIYTSLFLRKREDITILVAPGSNETEVQVRYTVVGRPLPWWLLAAWQEQIVEGQV